MSYHHSLRAKPNADDDDDGLPYRFIASRDQYGSLSLGFARGKRNYDIGLMMGPHIDSSLRSIDMEAVTRLRSGERWYRPNAAYRSLYRLISPRFQGFRL